jgi:hypothetical protein
MPSKSKAQRNLMAAAAHNPAFAKKVGVPMSVAKEFNQADKGKKFKGGGMMDKKDLMQDKKMAKKAVGMHEKQLHGGKKSNLAALKKGGRIASKGEHAVQKQSKRGAEVVKMCGGGMKKYAKGGGIEVRGKTKGKIC